MLDRELATCQGGEEVDFLLVEQVVFLAFEAVVRLLLDNNDHIAGGDARRLVALPTEVDGLAAAHALVDVHLEHLLLGHDLATIARLALVFVVDDLARARAVVARLLHLLDHRAHLSDDDAHTTPAAGCARAHRALLATLPTALDTDDIARERELRCLALVEVLERDMHAVNEIFCLAWALLP